MLKTFSALCLLLCTTFQQAASAQGAEWCQNGLNSNTGMGPEMDTIAVHPIRLSKVRHAMRLLKDENIYAVSENELDSLMLLSQPRPAGNYYLVRSGIFADRGRTPEEIKYTSDALTRRIFQFSAGDEHLSIINLQSSSARNLQGFPLLIRSSVTIRTAQAYCNAHW